MLGRGDNNSDKTVEIRKPKCDKDFLVRNDWIYSCNKKKWSAVHNTTTYCCIQESSVWWGAAFLI